jgi:integrase
MLDAIKTPRDNTRPIKKILTDKTVEKLKKARPGKRCTVWDGALPGFGIRVTDKGHLSYILAGRFAGSKNFTRREIAPVDTISLADARAKARAWIAVMQEGRDPTAVHKQALEEHARSEARKKAVTFEMVAEDFIKDRVVGPDPAAPLLRRAKYIASTIRDPFIKTWGNRPITDITRNDVLELIRKKKSDTREGARAQLANIKSLLSWALDQSYGLDRSVASDIKPQNVIGEKKVRDRILSDTELRALWDIANSWHYPIGPLYKMLMLSGLRLSEVAKATWSEFDLSKREWTIPATRMKGKNVGSDGRRAKDHLVPLSQDMIDVLNSRKAVPRIVVGILHPNESITRLIAGCVLFLILIQCFDLPP